MRWLAATVLFSGALLLALHAFNSSKSTTPPSTPVPVAAETHSSVGATKSVDGSRLVGNKSPKVHAAKPKIVAKDTVAPAPAVAAEEAQPAPAATQPAPRHEGITPEEALALMTDAAKTTRTPPRSRDANARKWLPTPSDLSLQNREKRTIDLECDEWKCPLKDKKTVPVFGVVVRPEADSTRFGHEMKRGSFVEKTPALYIE